MSDHETLTPPDEAPDQAQDLPAAQALVLLPETRQRTWFVPITLAILDIVLCTILVGMLDKSPASIRLPLSFTTQTAALPFDPDKLSSSDPALLKVLTSDQALAANAAKPISALNNPAARPLSVSSSILPDYQRSLDCMASAIYYEAAFEPEEGQRAVAQVVLNRVRHPIYPHTICGVVFQGAERATGCQFSFTCDGSLARTPSLDAWQRVRQIATAALAGYVYKPVGLATHYHADYVVPYWADSLLKSAVIGHHIFYRIPGSYGGPGAFDSRYAGNEPAVIEKIAPALLQFANGEQAPAQNAIGPATAATRSVLDTAGRIIADGKEAAFAGAAPLTQLSSTMAGKPAASGQSRAVATSKRWVLPFDGETQLTGQPKMEYKPVD